MGFMAHIRDLLDKIPAPIATKGTLTSSCRAYHLGNVTSCIMDTNRRKELLVPETNVSGSEVSLGKGSGGAKPVVLQTKSGI